MLSGPQRRFAEGIVHGLSNAAAYAAAYPKSSAANARKNAPRLAANEAIRAEVSRLRAKADAQAGSAVLTLMEKRIFLARIVRAQVALLSEGSDLWVSIKRGKEGIEMRLPDKIAAIKLDNDLAGEGGEAEADDAFAELLKSCMK